MQGSKCLTDPEANTTVRQNQAISFRESTEGLFDFACNSSFETKSFFLPTQTVCTRHRITVQMQKIIANALTHEPIDTMPKNHKLLMMFCTAI